MNDNLTEIVAILDNSGSMESLTDDTIGGYNSFLKEQKEIDGEAVLTTVLFNTNYTLLHDRLDIKEVHPIARKDYVAGGGTALLDAMGKTINDIGLKLHNTAEPERPARVIVFIITDGEENSSKEYTFDKIKEMVTLQQDVYKWIFIFLGANMDAFSVGDSIGISKYRYNYQADSEGIVFAQKSISSAIRFCRTSPLRDFDLNDLLTQDKKPKDKGKKKK